MNVHALAAVLCAVLIAVCFWSVLCRLAQIAPRPENLAAATQHLGLGAGLIFTFVALVEGWTGWAVALPMLVGLSVYLLAGARAWPAAVLQPVIPAETDR